ncbi:MAG: MurR/RpiR family transcriptional regulator [Acidobacteria bacterium]|nr:MurR/RpiR family transcriptional regulator [Acidobacteriota bacterium]MBA3884212.1 MurR/RpiR family transcriptional regulator [Acidobacteriota bacterium]
MPQIKHIAPDRAGCLLRLRSARELFKPAEATVAEFVLARPERVLQMSVSEVARDSGVGEATVIRFCRAAGYKGYQEFKLRLAQDLVEPVEFIHENISFDDATQDLVQKVFQTNQKAVEDTQRAVDPRIVEVAAKALASARRVDIYGVGYSYFSALDLKLKLVRFGLSADALGDPHLQLMAAVTLKRGDVAIGISHSGSTRDVVDALGPARKAGATTMAITNYSPSPLTRVADLVLLTASPESPLGGEVLTSRIAQLCVIDVLSVAVAVTLGESCLELIKKTSQAVKRKRY